MKKMLKFLLADANPCNELKEIIRLEPANQVKSEFHTERTIFLNMTFVKSTGNLAITAPAVPG
jgi:hypothetical protein